MSCLPRSGIDRQRGGGLPESICTAAACQAGLRLYSILPMRTVTAIEAQKRNPNRVNIYLDDQFAFGLARVTAAWLRVGQALSDEKIAALQTDDACEVAMQKALHFLSFRPRSVLEVRKNLDEHEFSDEVIDKTLARLSQAGLLGDEQFARTWIENRNTFRPRGKRVLALELKQKGIEEDVIRATLAESGDEKALALEAGRKYARRLGGLAWPEFRNKLAGHLVRRGFGYEIVSETAKQIWNEYHLSESGQIDERD